jgi:flagellar basal-body rod protein FlgC
VSGGFDTFDVGRSGLTLSKTWLDTIANNIANVNTVHPAGQQPFRASYLVAQEIGPALPGQSGQGVRAIGQVDDGSPPAVVSAPGNPLADANGNLTEPVVDLGVEMTNMIMANRSFQANGRTIETARDMYTAALRIGR